MKRLVLMVVIAVVLYTIHSGRQPLYLREAQAQAARSIADIQRLLEKRDEPWYFFVPGNTPREDTLARVTYLAAEHRLLVDIVVADLSTGSGPNGRQLREINSTDQVVKQRLTGTFDASLIFAVCGDNFGDDDCDMYSPLGARPQFGREITMQAKRVFGTYLEAIGNILGKK
jgi:hypothetical protein